LEASIEGDAETGVAKKGNAVGRTKSPTLSALAGIVLAVTQ
jgi:hypothetical protein